MKDIFYGILNIFIIITTIALLKVERIVDLSEKFSNKQIIEIGDNFVLGKYVYIYDLKTKEKPSIILVYEETIRKYKVGDIIKK